MFLSMAAAMRKSPRRMAKISCRIPKTEASVTFNASIKMTVKISRAPTILEKMKVSFITVGQD